MDAEEEEKHSRKHHTPDTLERQIEEWVEKEGIDLQEELNKTRSEEGDEEEDRGENKWDTESGNERKENGKKSTNATRN